MGNEPQDRTFLTTGKDLATETIFTAEVCQGNFHHHRKWTGEAYEAKLSALAATGRKEMMNIRPSETVLGKYK